MHYPNYFKIKAEDALWLFMYFVLFSAPIFPGRNAFGFYSVEWSFFFFAAIFMSITLLSMLVIGNLSLEYDGTLLFICFLFTLMVLSGVDANSKLRVIIYALSFIPCFFIMYFTISVIDDEEKFNKVMDMVTHLIVLFSLVVIVAEIMIHFGLMPGMLLKSSGAANPIVAGDRWYLDNFLLNVFNIGILKVISYMEFPFSVLTVRIMSEKANLYRVSAFLIICVAIVLTGSRGNYAVLFIICALAFLKIGNFGKKLLIGILVGSIILTAVLSTDYVRERLALMIITSQRDLEDNAVAFARLYTGKVALSIMLDHPINGVGLWNLSYVMSDAIRSTAGIPKIILDYWNSTLLFQTETTPLKLGSEIGVGGFVFFFVWYFYLWNRVRKALKRAPIRLKNTLDGAYIALIAGFAHNFVDVSFYNYYTWLYYGLIVAIVRITQKEKDRFANEMTGGSAFIPPHCRVPAGLTPSQGS